MKSVWLWLVFLLLYGVFSMKTHAADLDVAAQSEISRSGGAHVSLRSDA